MRTIKFRAKASTNARGAGIKKGDWVYGSYIESDCDAPCIIFGDGEQIEIDRETLGQLVGLHDQSGADIYEGDALRKHHDDGESNYEGIVSWIVEYDWLGWCSMLGGYPELLRIEDQDSLEIIGNIFDRPELAR